MYLDYSKLEFDVNGLPETPQLVLKTLGDKMVGIIPGVHNLKLNIKFSEPSEISFDIPAVIDGEPNPLYDDVTGYKQIYTKCYGFQPERVWNFGGQGAGTCEFQPGLSGGDQLQPGYRLYLREQ